MADHDLSNSVARKMGDALLDDLHLVQATYDGQTALAAALSAMSAALNFVRSACGDDAAAMACKMLTAIERERRDILVPAGRARR